MKEGSQSVPFELQNEISNSQQKIYLKALKLGFKGFLKYLLKGKCIK
jgi:hypothetical protein